MTRRGALLVLLALCSIAGWCGAAEPAPAQVDREVTALIAGLAASGCEFNRNGRWYDGPRAASHLRRKYDHVRKRTPLPDTETFIDLAATRSSLSGQPYRVRCGKNAPMESRTWFLARLGMLRGPKGLPAPHP